MNVQHWCAPNDVNGNPRRLFVVFDDQGNIARIVDEGYRGEPADIRALVHLPSVRITATEYRNLIKRGEHS